MNRLYLLPILLIGLFLPIRATMITITVGGLAPVVINDGKEGDSSTDVNVINFDTTGIKILEAAGIYAEGTVSLGKGGAITKLGDADILRLTDLRLYSTVNGVKKMNIVFNHTFAAGKKIKVADGIKGTFDTQGIGSGKSQKGDSLTYQGYVDEAGIGDPFAFVSVGGVGSALNPGEPFSDEDGPFEVAGDGNYVLKGDLNVTLNFNGSVLKLPNSAEVGIETVPEPSTVAMMGAGLLLIVIAGVRRRQKPVCSAYVPSK